MRLPLDRGAARLRLQGLREEWRARIREAARFTDGPRVQPLNTEDLAFRGIVLTAVLVLTAAFVAIMAMPGVAVMSKTVNGIADKFAGELGPSELPEFAERSVIVDRDGETIATLAGEENRKIVELKQIPKIAQQAVLAIEDAKFYEHGGVDLQGLIRALMSNIKAGGVREGGSTITQQLVKNTLVGTERSLDRKVREARLAAELEKRMTKDDILELYLNRAYFGAGVYGIGTASEYYFGKRVEKLTLPEAALLAGIVKAPETYQPITNPEPARNRRRLVLRRMQDENMITEAQRMAAEKAPMPKKAHPLPKAKDPYFVEYVKQQILSDRRFGETADERAATLFGAGLRIETTLDLDLQAAAKRANERILDRKDDPASALVSLDVETGAVRAMVGGRDFEKEKYNLATQGKRQPGSTFKPVTMVAALEAGLEATQTFDTPSPLKMRDPGSGKQIEVNNYDERGRGFMDMRGATEQSVNTYYMQLIQKVGAERVAETAKRMGVRTPIKPVLALSLGTEVVTPLDMATVYATLGNGGVRCEPHGITRVLDSHGDVIFRTKPKCERAISKDVAATATSILRGVITRGTGRANAQIGRPAAGKTGTTDNYVDSWFAGYTRQLSTVVWLGFPDDNTKPLHNIHGLPQVFGGSLPARIWASYMKAAHRGLRSLGFPEPPGVPGVAVPNVVGKPVAEAKDLLEDAGFTVTTEEVSSDRPDGEVVSQSPEGDTSAGKGSLVTLSVSGDGPSAESEGSGGEAEPSPTPTPAASPKPTAKPGKGDGKGNGNKP